MHTLVLTESQLRIIAISVKERWDRVKPGDLQEGWTSEQAEFLQVYLDEKLGRSMKKNDSEGKIIQDYLDLVEFTGVLGFRVVVLDEDFGGIVISQCDEQNTVVYEGSTLAEGMSWCMGYSRALSHLTDQLQGL